jgi:hypothetical protein
MGKVYMLGTRGSGLGMQETPFDTPLSRLAQDKRGGER